MEFRRTEIPPKKKEFVWSDDEVELLLNIANDYKASKAAESVNWESVNPNMATFVIFLLLLYLLMTLT